MKSKNMLISVLSLMFFTVFFIPNIAVGESLVGYWNFDEGTGSITNDTSGNGNNGTIIGATWVNGISSKALNFNGLNDYVLISTQTNLNFEWNQPITIETWVNLSSAAFAGNGIFGKFNGDTVPIRGYLFTIESRDTGELNLNYNVFNDHNVTGNRMYGYSNENFVPYVGSWHHVAVTYDGSGSYTGISFFIDGIKATTKSSSGFNQCNSTILNTVTPTIGAVDNGAYTFFHGAIDELKIYDYIRTDKQILLDASVGIISGKITKPDNVSPISCALVEVYQNDILKTQTNTDVSGNYSTIVTTGTYWIFVSSRGYLASLNKNITVNTGQTTTLNVSLNNGDTGLVGYWPLNEGSGNIAFDYSGNTSSGIIHGATWTDTVKGKTLSFDGVNDYVDILNKSNFDFEWNQPLTMEAWINIDFQPSSIGKNIFGKFYAHTSPISGYIFTLDSADPGEINLVFRENHNYEVTGERMYGYTEENISSFIGSWHHVAVTYNGSGYYTGIKLYLDGIPATTKTDLVNNQSQCTASILNSLIPCIGATENGTDGFFKGKIDELKIYNYVRTVQQIAQDAGVDTTPPSSPAAVRDGTGSDIDKSPRGVALSANWDASTDPESNIARYWYKFTGEVNWSSTTATNVSKNVAWTTQIDLVGTTIYCTVKAENASGLQSSETTSDGCWYVDSISVNPPVISNVTAVNITQTGATIIWNTDKAATSQVKYGLTAGYGTLTNENSSLVASHSVTITGLTPGTQFHYRVISKDSSNNESISADYTFTTLPSGVTPPAIINISIINITKISVTIVWTTDKPATSQIEYGFTTDYGSTTVINTDLVTSHSITVTGLTIGIDYHYRIRITDNSGNETISDDNTFQIPISITSDNPPNVTITYPGNRQTIQGNLTVQAEASDDKGITKVEFFVDGVKKNTNQVGPYHWIWDTTLESDGEHVLKAIAYDTIGQTANAEITVIIHQKPNDVDIRGELKPIEPVVKPGHGKKATICYTVDLPEDKKQTAGQNALVHVKITIHTLRGTLVKILVDQDMPLGAYKEYWDGTNFAQEVAASGVYIVKLQAGDFRDMKKIVVVK